MGKRDEKPELAMFTLLNPDFYGVREDQFVSGKEKEQTTIDLATETENDNQR